MIPFNNLSEIMLYFSGGHINPAVTLAMCILGRTEWKKMVPFWLAQYLGAIVASACIYGVYLGEVVGVIYIYIYKYSSHSYAICTSGTHLNGHLYI